MKRDERKERAFEALTNGEDWKNSRYEFTVDYPVIRVRDIVRGTLAAYSEAKADFRDAAAEFVEDYA